MEGPYSSVGSSIAVSGELGAPPDNAKPLLAHPSLVTQGLKEP